MPIGDDERIIQKKVCMLGAFGVGKTSLVDRLVRNTFSDHPRMAVGVRIDRGRVEVDGRKVNLVIWDLHGDEEFQKVRKSYLRGAAGHLLVADGTRPTSLDEAVDIIRLAETTCSGTPSLLLLNKTDRTEDWRVEPARLEELAAQGWTTLRTSARSGEGVLEAFRAMARAILQKDPGGPADRGSRTRTLT